MVGIIHSDSPIRPGRSALIPAMAKLMTGQAAVVRRQELTPMATFKVNR